MKDIAFAAILIGFCSGIMVVANDGKIIDTILNSLSNLLAGTGNVLFVVVMYIVQSVLTLLVPSSSGLQMMIDGGAELATASRGAEGCVLYDGETFYRQPAVPIEKVVDTMGAGDSLITSFLVGYTDRIKKGEEKSEAIKNALADAAKFASEICGLEGAFGYGRHYE